MRIAFFSDNFYPELSGISDSIIATAKQLASRGHIIRFYAPSHPPKNFALLKLPYGEPDLGPNISIERFPAVSYPTGTSQGRAVIPTGLRWHSIARFAPDALHAHLPFGTGLEGMIAAKRLGKPFIGTNHTPMSEFVRYSPVKFPGLESLVLKYTVWFYNHCEFMSSPAQSIIDEMKAYGFRRPAAVVSNPIDASGFGPAPAAEKAALKKKYGFSDFTVLYAGRLAPEKRIDLMIRAAAKLSKEIPELTYAIVGRGSDEARLRALARNLGVEDRVKLMGFIEDQNVFAEIYRASDLFVMMSTAETQSIVAMQAMACGIPVIASKSWGLGEYIDPESGILIEPGKEDSLPNDVLRLFRDPALRARMGESGERQVKRFAPPAVADIWEKTYSHAIAAYGHKEA